jgi:hypothetical protein
VAAAFLGRLAISGHPHPARAHPDDPPAGASRRVS